jgi:hypothetical protein
LANTDGDPLVFQTLHFEVESAEFAAKSLAFLSERKSGEPGADLQSDLENLEAKKFEITWFKKEAKRTAGVPRTALGTVYISGEKLTAEVNSEKRSKKLKKLILETLGDKVKYVARVVEDPKMMMKKVSQQPHAQSAAIPLNELPPEALESIKVMAAKHWENWLTKKILL